MRGLRAAALGLALGAGALHAQPMLEHVHGLGFSPEGTLLVSSHRGLAAFRDGAWSAALESNLDFTGFSVARRAMYASGHPAAGAALPNPLGLARSADGGASWTTLALGGEADFHLIAASWRASAIYVFAHLPNRTMQRPGLYLTYDEGKTWRHANASSLRGEILSIAAHPGEPQTLAAASDQGLFVSRDEGGRFRRIDGSQPMTAVVFDIDGERVRYTGALSRALFESRINGSGRRMTALPALGSDYVTHIAQHPGDARTLAFATRRRHVYLSTNAGTSWRQIAREGDLP